MPKSSHSRVKRLFTALFNVKSWIDLERIRSAYRYLVEQASTYFIPQKEQKKESFDLAKERLKLSDQDILARQKGLLRLTQVMLAMAFLIFIYALYNLFYAYYPALIVSIMVMMLALVMAFRYHFWYFQIKHQRLGCSLHEWFMQGILGAKDE